MSLRTLHDLRCLIAFACLAAGAEGRPALARDDDVSNLGEFFATFCFECHGERKTSGKLDLTGYDWSGSRFDLGAGGKHTSRGVRQPDGGVLERIRAMLAGGEMPPEKKPQPASGLRRRVVKLLGEALRESGAGEVGDDRGVGRVTMRRLNRVEYANTIRDLVGVDFDAAGFLPADNVGHGFDNIGDVLAMPPLLLEKYFDAAERIAADAFPDPLPDKPPIREVSGKDLRHTGKRKPATRGDGRFLSTNATLFIEHDFPRSGRYRLHVIAAGQQAGPEPVKVQFVLDRRRLETVEVRATYDEPERYSTEIDATVGPHRVGAAFINDYYKPDAEDRSQRDRNCAIFGLAIEGPLDAPLVAQGTGTLELRERDPGRWVDETVRDLAWRSYRRPVSERDIAALLALCDADAGPDARVRAALTAMLVSPRFLFRPEPSSGGPRPLSDHELAARLSYFVWSSTPDEALLLSAERGELGEPGELVRQADRLLRDPRSFALSENFAGQWLQIRDLERRTPDTGRFPGVDVELLESMKAETMLLFDAIMREGRDVRELLASDFTFLDERLARHYGVAGVRGNFMRRVRLPRGRMGGLIAHASVLTTTSNPTRTSPVKRGKWILSALLDAPPNPPPPGTVSFEQARQAFGGGTMREILGRHRADPDCAVCHRKMDALGFALEEFDAVGRFRKTDGGLPVDSIGELPDGRRLEGARDLQALLLADDAFLRSMARHMLTYALGRGLTDDDDRSCERLIATLKEEPSIASLVKAIVRLRVFRTGGAARSNDDATDANP